MEGSRDRGIEGVKMKESGWPGRPANEIFPELMDTTLVAQMLLYDLRGKTPEQGRRNVRKLVHEYGLPTLGRMGSSLYFDREAVKAWLVEFLKRKDYRDD